MFKLTALLLLCARLFDSANADSFWELFTKTTDPLCHVKCPATRFDNLHAWKEYVDCKGPECYVVAQPWVSWIVQTDCEMDCKFAKVQPWVEHALTDLVVSVIISCLLAPLIFMWNIVVACYTLAVYGHVNCQVNCNGQQRSWMYKVKCEMHHGRNNTFSWVDVLKFAGAVIVKAMHVVIVGFVSIQMARRHAIE